MTYKEIVAEKNRLVANYRDTAAMLRSEDLSALRDNIQRHRADAEQLLDQLLLEDFQDLGIRYEQPTWDMTKGKEGKPSIVAHSPLPTLAAPSLPLGRRNRRSR